MSNKIITRFPPSPTGFLHVGGLRTALYNYLFAKKNNGKFFLRIEDTDQERKVEGAAENLEKILKEFSLYWDNKAPMVQSLRLSKYKQVAEQLVAQDKAYYCFCSKERLDECRKEQQKNNQPTMYDGACIKLSKEEINQKLKAKENHVIRFKMIKVGHTEFKDLVRGKVVFENKLIDDQVIIKSDGFPTYHLASVVDDNEMGVSHVIRGEEWLSSTPKHIAIYKALNYDIPEFAHLPLLLNADKSKLSKRQGDVAVEDYLKKGYLKEALLNFVLLLGWNPKTDQEIFSLKEMIDSFDIEKVNKAGAVFNTEKLDWLNSEYIKKLNPKDLAKMAKPYFDEAKIKTNLKFLEKVVKTEQERIKKLDELVEATEFFFNKPKYDTKDLIWKKSDQKSTAEYLSALIDFLKSIKKKNWTTEKLEEEVKKFITEKNWGMGDVLWPMRFALSGRKASPSPFEIAFALDQKETIERLEQAQQNLEK